MAFIPEEDQDSPESGMNVLANQSQMQQSQGANGQPQDATPASQQTQQISTGPSSTIGGAPAPIGSQPPQSQGTRKKEGSGMFTNVRKYIQANKPVAQKMSGAVTGNIQQQAGALQQQVQNKQQQYQQSLGQAQANLQQSQQFAKDTVQKAGSGQLSDQDFMRFHNLSTGKETVVAPEALNVMDQSARASALQNLASRANQESGRQALLKNVFGENQRYTRGQQNLDALLLGSDPTANKQLVDQVKATTGELTDEIAQARQAALQSTAKAQMEARRMPEELLGMVGTAQDQLQGSVAEQLETRRQQLLQEQQEFNQALASGTLTEDQLKRFIDDNSLDAAARKRQEDLYAQALMISNPNRDYTSMWGSQNVRNLASAFDDKTNTKTVGQNALTLYNSVQNLAPMPHWKNYSPNAQDWKEELDLGGNPLYNAVGTLKELGYRDEDIVRMIDRPLQEKSTEIQENYSKQNPLVDIKGSLANPHSMIAPGYRDDAEARTEVYRQQKLADQIASIAAKVDSRTQIQEFLKAANEQKRRDLGSYLQATDINEIKESDVVTPEMVARQEALARLSGQQVANPLTTASRNIQAGDFDLYGALRKLGIYR
jgi:hypothetical protein